MLANKVANAVLHRTNKQCLMQVANIHHEKRGIGAREIVGWGVNSIPHYIDRQDFPFPAIRFKEIKGDLIPLREKEKGDWKKLTLDEKKQLYRASFCQTFSEMHAPTGEIKSVAGMVFIAVSLGIIFMILLRQFVKRPVPDSVSEQNRQDQLRRMLDLKVNPVTGISSKWDYEKDDWKK